MSALIFELNPDKTLQVGCCLTIFNYISQLQELLYYLGSKNSPKKFCRLKLPMSGAAEQSLSPCYRLTPTTEGGLESSTSMSMKMIETRKNGLQKIVSGLERRVVPLQRQKEDLQLVLNTVNNWVQVLNDTQRWNSGVPILRSAKENCDDLITPYLNDSDSDFNQAVFRLGSAEIPGFAQAQKLLKSIRHEIRVIFEKESTFNGKFVEDVRVLMGQVTGIISAILGLYYQTNN
ncbi:uncharacterized protein LOC116297535 [Actinia tenebrosa]|uniref:Uncharacterized protein LOC116297535 n=1 Tax=Actinia tenebrosa TaxID=6105 RepID=A0A6P8I958_ACTTE|nr:uncharacterized protein LOC116297535 [Actinia tenebrosa]